MKRFCFWLFNGLLLSGLAFFSFYFFIKGDTFHGWFDLLYMVIVASNILLRRQHHVMEEQVRELRKENAELTKKNAELMEHLRQINDPFSYNKTIMIAHNVRMERIVTDYKYSKVTTKRKRTAGRAFWNRKHEVNCWKPSLIRN